MTELGVTGKGSRPGSGRAAGSSSASPRSRPGSARWACRARRRREAARRRSPIREGRVREPQRAVQGRRVQRDRGSRGCVEGVVLRRLRAEHRRAAKFIDGLTFGITKFSDTYKSNEGQFKAVGEQLAALAGKDYSQGANSFNKLVKQLGAGTRSPGRRCRRSPPTGRRSTTSSVPRGRRSPTRTVCPPRPGGVVSRRRSGRRRTRPKRRRKPSARSVPPPPPGPRP
jgi:hypothetical protein